MGEVLLAQKQKKAAIRCFQADLAIARRLRRLDPTNARWRSDLSQARLRFIPAWGALWSVRVTAVASYIALLALPNGALRQSFSFVVRFLGAMVLSSLFFERLSRWKRAIRRGFRITRHF